MSDTLDLDALAREYIALWQEHLQSVANDPETLHMLTQSLDLMNSSAQAFAHMAAQGSAFAAKDAAQKQGSDHAPTPSPAHPTSPGTAASPPTPRPSDVDCAQFASRIAALEERVHRLESEARNTNAKPRTKASRRRP
ncbi:hypothetical protein [Varunaivibrio sulfuroxidans]|uniref:hypothetical protein n=1 Tax=Varunaivibrio sulfuroxidans TaxID=1773489 RepID=UPI0014046E50|nr:hypothetical protein [Varunaivibrio sulfuroxidans]WES32100.1 hypothetical protein P3M64_07010 [Varunaivibrio sulfuroxidans]